MMPSCATCGETEDLRLYERRDAPGEERWWWCGGCSAFAARLQGMTADPVPRWVERASLHGLPARTVEERPDRRTGFGRRATDRVFRTTGAE
jgi:hypothetical protein